MTTRYRTYKTRARAEAFAQKMRERFPDHDFYPAPGPWGCPVGVWAIAAAMPGTGSRVAYVGRRK